MTILQAEKDNVENFSVFLQSHYDRAFLETQMLDSPHLLNGFFGPGHVSRPSSARAVTNLFRRNTAKSRLSLRVLNRSTFWKAIRRAVIQLEAGEAKVENAYERVVTCEGNIAAQKMLADVFETKDRAWRGIGVIPQQRLDFERKLPRFR